MAEKPCAAAHAAHIAAMATAADIKKRKYRSKRDIVGVPCAGHQLNADASYPYR